MRTAWFESVMLAATVVACGSSDAIHLTTDSCQMPVVQVKPALPVLQLGDTVTMRASFIQGAPPECLPSDTTAASLRWSSADTADITIDPAVGRLTARRPGWAEIVVVPAGSHRMLGGTVAEVLEPLDADSLISSIASGISDSATVILKDAAGSTLRTVTLHGFGSVCWNTPLSDSVQYSAQVFLPGDSVATPIAAKWVVKVALRSTHTWLVDIDPQSSALPTLELRGVTPDQGC